MIGSRAEVVSSVSTVVYWVQLGWEKVAMAIVLAPICYFTGHRCMGSCGGGRMMDSGAERKLGWASGRTRRWEALPCLPKTGLAWTLL